LKTSITEFLYPSIRYELYARRTGLTNNRSVVSSNLIKCTRSFLVRATVPTLLTLRALWLVNNFVK